VRGNQCLSVSSLFHWLLVYAERQSDIVEFMGSLHFLEFFFGLQEGTIPETPHIEELLYILIFNTNYSLPIKLHVRACVFMYVYTYIYL
jgi:hypothetical protein